MNPEPIPWGDRPRSRRSCLVAVLALALVAVSGAEASQKVALSTCPEPVRTTIYDNLHGGKVDEIKRIAVDDRVLYLVEIDRKGAKDIKLHISGGGTLLKTVEEVRMRDVPPGVRESIDTITAAGGRASDIDRVVIEDRVEYHVEIKRPKSRKLRFIFDESGYLLGQK